MNREETFFLEHNGVRYEGIQHYSVKRDMDNFCGTFAFEIAGNITSKKVPFKGHDKIKIYINDTLLMTGFIEQIVSKVSAEDFSIEFSGRDITCDLLDSTMSVNFEIQAVISLEDIILKVLASLGLNSIKVINCAGKIDPFTPKSKISAEPCVNCFEFIEKFARQRQVFINTNEQGNIVLTRGAMSKHKIMLLNVLGAKDNNIMDSSVSLDYTQVYRNYKLLAQEAPSAEILDTDASVSLSYEAEDNKVRRGRTLCFTAEVSGNEGIAERVKWERNVRAARTLEYSCSVPYLLPDGELWRIGSTVMVNDDAHNINEHLLLKAFEFEVSAESKKISLSFRKPSAYTLQAQLDEFELKNNKITEYEPNEE